MSNSESFLSPDDEKEIQEIKASLEEKNKFKQFVRHIGETINGEQYPNRSQAALNFSKKHGARINKLLGICNTDQMLTEAELSETRVLIQDFEEKVLSINS